MFFSFNDKYVIKYYDKCYAYYVHIDLLCICEDWRKNKLQLLSSLLTIYHKGLYYECVGVFNKLPHNIAELILHNKSLTKLKSIC
jgi:hypothetical protein